MNTELIFALICGALLGAGALAGKLGLTDRLPLILYVSAYVFGGWFTTKEAISNIRQNLGFAFAYNAAGIPVAAGILYPVFGIVLSPVVGAAAMALSSVSVIANALRLARMRL